MTQMEKYLAIVSAIGLIGLVISLVLLSEYSTQLMNIFKLMMESVFGTKMS